METSWFNSMVNRTAGLSKAVRSPCSRCSSTRPPDRGICCSSAAPAICSCRSLRRREKRAARSSFLALEPTILKRVTPAGPGVDSMVESWARRWCERLPGLPAPEEGAPLEAFHRTIQQRLVDEELRRRTEERVALEQSRKRADETARQAVAELTSVIEVSETPTSRGPDLYMAAVAIGRFQGIRFRQPASWESETLDIDPVEMIARASHVRTRRVVLSDRWWRRDNGPLLAFSGEERRPVALLPGKAGGYEIVEPRSHERVTVNREVASTLDPHAHVFYAPLPDEAGRGIELLRFALRGRSRDLTLILATATVATLLGMFTPQATALIVDNAIPDADFGLLIQIGLGLFAAALGSGVFRLSQGIAMMRVEMLADTTTQSAVWDRLLNLQMAFFRRFSTGDLESRVTAGQRDSALPRWNDSSDVVRGCDPPAQLRAAALLQPTTDARGRHRGCAERLGDDRHGHDDPGAARA